MRASDDILSFRVYAILVRDNPPLPAYDERRWAAVAGYADSDFQASLEAFALRRDELVTMLRRAALDDWQRVGTLDGGETISIQRVVALLVDHEEEHCAQLEAHVQALKVPSPPRQ